jgi:hypothetical protein
MVKRLFLLVASVVVFLGSVCAPVRLHADGNPMCPPGRSCYPVP